MEQRVVNTIDEYLLVSKYINWNNNSILSKADEFKLKFADEISLVKIDVIVVEHL